MLVAVGKIIYYDEKLDVMQRNDGGVNSGSRDKLSGKRGDVRDAENGDYGRKYTKAQNLFPRKRKDFSESENEY